MKHTLKITFILLGMFLLTQFIGLFILNQYSPENQVFVDSSGNTTNVTTYNLPYGMDPPPEVEKQSVSNMATSFVIVFAIAIIIMLLLMKFKADIIIRVWFFVVVVLAISISFNSVLSDLVYGSTIAILLSLPLAFYKIFKRNILIHNLTELLIYPGIAAIFVALVLSSTKSPVLAVSVILILISLYDMYAVWHSGFMQRMAKYQIQNLKLFTGFFIPYLGKKEKDSLKKLNSKKLKNKKVKVSVAILGGGDVVFPILLSGVVLHSLGLFPAIIISLCATLALAGLFWFSEKGKFYPAMPFISAGCFVGLAIAYLV